MSRSTASGPANGMPSPFAMRPCAISTATANGRTAIDMRGNCMDCDRRADSGEHATRPGGSCSTGRRCSGRSCLRRRPSISSCSWPCRSCSPSIIRSVPIRFTTPATISSGCAISSKSCGTAFFSETLANTFIFTFASLIIGLVLGKFGALLLLRPFPGRRIVRALIILPWAVPVALATVAWEWMFNSLYSVINWTLMALGLMTRARRRTGLAIRTWRCCASSSSTRGGSFRLRS